LNFFSIFKRNLIYKFKNKISIDSKKVEYKSLDELFHYYGSDKANIFRIKNSKGHGFSKFYEDYLLGLRNKKLKILEVGSYAGASAAAFSNYIPDAKIICLDINISNFKYSSKNIEVFGVDIKNKKQVGKILTKVFSKFDFSKFDLIIDDGSHKLSDILFSIKFFFEHLSKGGFYVIEDYKHPNYYIYNKDIDDILIDDFIKCLEKKKFFNSLTLNKADQDFLFNNIESIKTFKGNLEDSDICFISKN